MGLHVCPPFITLYGHVICNGAVHVRGLMLSNYPVFGSSTFWWCWTHNLSATKYCTTSHYNVRTTLPWHGSSYGCVTEPL